MYKIFSQKIYLKSFYTLFLILHFSCQNHEQINQLKEDTIQTGGKVLENNIIKDAISNNNTNFIKPENSKGGLINDVYMCSYKTSLKANNIILKEPSVRALKQVDNIVEFSGLPSNFSIFSAHIGNAAAATVGSNRIILYDEELLNAIDVSTNNYWSSISILAHEVGHHLAGHTISSIASPKQELEADEFSGFILFKLGASLEQSDVAINLLGSETSSGTHPSKFIRREAINKGWLKASKFRYNSAIPPPPSENLELEYTIDMLWDKISLTRDAYMYKDMKYFYGIVTDVEVKESSERSRFQVNFVDTNSDGSKVISQEREWIEYYAPLDGENMSNVARSWFYEVLKPGRRLRFSFIRQGSGGYTTLTYLKALPGDSF